MNLLTPPNDFLFYLSSALALLPLTTALYFAPWRALCAENSRQHCFFGAVVVLGCFWLMQVEVRESLALHPLAITLVTLLFGWSLALIAGALALAMLSFLHWGLGQPLNLTALPVDFWLSVVVPASWTLLVLWAIERWLSRHRELINPFFYFLGAGFFGAMTAIPWIGLNALALFQLTGNRALAAMVEDHALLFFVLMFPEGFINGALATLLAVLWPDALKTYRDDIYLRR